MPAHVSAIFIISLSKGFLATNKLQSLGLPSYSNLLLVLTWLVLVPKDAFCFCAFSSLASLHSVLATSADSQITYIPNASFRTIPFCQISHVRQLLWYFPVVFYHTVSITKAPLIDLCTFFPTARELLTAMSEVCIESSQGEGYGTSFLFWARRTGFHSHI